MSGEPEYFIKTYDANGDSEVSPALTFEQAQEWVNREGAGYVFDVLRVVNFTITDVTATFTRDRRFVDAVRNTSAAKKEYVEPLTFLSLF